MVARFIVPCRDWVRRLPYSGAGGSGDKMFIVNYLSASRGAPGWSKKGSGVCCININKLIYSTLLSDCHAPGSGEIQGTCPRLKAATGRCGTFMHRPAGRMMRPHALDLPDCIRNIVLCINEFKSQQFFRYLYHDRYRKNCCGNKYLTVNKMRLGALGRSDK